MPAAITFYCDCFDNCAPAENATSLFIGADLTIAMRVSNFYGTFSGGVGDTGTEQLWQRWAAIFGN